MECHLDGLVRADLLHRTVINPAATQMLLQIGVSPPAIPSQRIPFVHPFVF